MNTLMKISPQKMRMVMGLLAGMIVAHLANCQDASRAKDIIPLIQMENVPLTDAIKNLARQMDLNYVLDPRLSDSSLSGRSARDMPNLTLSWTNLTAEQALSTILKERGLVMLTSPATSVTRITLANQAVKAGPATQPGGDTNPVIPLIIMDSVPLGDAIRNIAKQAHLNVSLDPQLSRPLSGSTTRTILECEVTLRWKNLTAQQALTALLENYDLILIQDAAAPVARIAARQQAEPGKPPNR
jgi:hypothetical protein